MSANCGSCHAVQGCPGVYGSTNVAVLCEDFHVITCVVHYTIEPKEIESFEQFARAWMELVNKHGGNHHGYFLPSEGSSDTALALFTFESLAAYETYRLRFNSDPEFIEADRIRDESGCVVRYERTFMRPLFPNN
jgi:hypothetical protein